MKLNDEAVLEPLNLETADLSSRRQFVKGTVGGSSDEEDPTNLTRSILQVRGILSRSRISSRIEAPEKNIGPASTELDFDSRSSKPAPKLSVVWVPVVPMSRDAFDVLQRFDGTILKVTQDSFVARLIDRTKPSPEEEAEIPLAEIMPGDRELVQPGAMFYWIIGYRREAHGQLSRSSVIRFQRLPSWSPSDVERATKEAKTFLSFLDLDRANNPA